MQILYTPSTADAFQCTLLRTLFIYFVYSFINLIKRKVILYRNFSRCSPTKPVNFNNKFSFYSISGNYSVSHLARGCRWMLFTFVYNPKTIQKCVGWVVTPWVGNVVWSPTVNWLIGILFILSVAWVSRTLEKAQLTTTHFDTSPSDYQHKCFMHI